MSPVLQIACVGSMMSVMEVLCIIRTESRQMRALGSSFPVLLAATDAALSALCAVHPVEMMPFSMCHVAEIVRYVMRTIKRTASLLTRQADGGEMSTQLLKEVLRKERLQLWVRCLGAVRELDVVRDMMSLLAGVVTGVMFLEGAPLDTGEAANAAQSTEVRAHSPCLLPVCVVLLVQPLQVGFMKEGSCIANCLVCTYVGRQAV